MTGSIPPPHGPGCTPNPDYDYERCVEHGHLVVEPPPEQTPHSVSLEDWRFDTEGSLTHALCGSVYEVPPCSLTRLLALCEQHVCPVTATSQNAPLPRGRECPRCANEISDPDDVTCGTCGADLPSANANDS